MDQGHKHADWFSDQSLTVFGRRGRFGSAGQNRMAMSDVLRFLRCMKQRYIYILTPATELQLTARVLGAALKFILMLDKQGRTPVYVKRNM